MHRLLILSALLAGTTVVAPVVARADDHGNHDRRYYDRDGRDYHSWDDKEDRAYRVYMQEQHRDYREFNREKANRQREYFKWRHDHPDHVLFRVEIK